jgi:HNH endonuclease
VRGSIPSRAWRTTPTIANAKLFARDRHICAYCGGRFHFEDLTREHIVPVSRGGSDAWMNCITACRACNGHKGNRLPEEAHMTLMYLPYVPSLHEDMILRGRRILADQMEFLLASVPRSSRLHT